MVPERHRLARVAGRLARGARRVGVLPAVAFACVVAVLLVAVYQAGERPASGDPTVGESVRVGVGQGESIPGYIDRSHAALTALASNTPVYALVSLTGYQPPERLAAVVEGVDVARVYARVPLPGAQTEIVMITARLVPQDVLAGMDGVAARKASERADYLNRATHISGGSPADGDLRALYARYADIAGQEAAAYAAHCACVYAIVVRAMPDALVRLAARAQVRVVEPAPQVRRLDRAVFLPPLPEQVDTVVPPPDRVIESPSPR
jgi:hypothetical protein